MMNADEILEEVDRRRLTLWHQRLEDMPSRVSIRVHGKAPDWLRQEIADKDNTDNLLKKVNWQPGKQPGIFVRKPSE